MGSLPTTKTSCRAFLTVAFVVPVLTFQLLAGARAFAQEAASVEPGAARPIIMVTAQLGQAAGQFFAANPTIDPKPHLGQAGAELPDMGFMFLHAFADRPAEPDGYILRYEKGDCAVSLPAGRDVFFGQTAGFLTNFAATLPREPLSFDQMMALAQEIAARFDKAGWKRLNYNAAIVAENFGKNGPNKTQEKLGEWVPCNEAGLVVAIALVNHSDVRPGMMEPAALTAQRPADAPPHYVVEVRFMDSDMALYDEAIALRDARRLAVNGDTDKPLTFKLWVDEPDWRPKDWQGQFIK